MLAAVATVGPEATMDSPLLPPETPDPSSLACLSPSRAGCAGCACRVQAGIPRRSSQMLWAPNTPLSPQQPNLFVTVLSATACRKVTPLCTCWSMGVWSPKEAGGSCWFGFSGSPAVSPGGSRPSPEPGPQDPQCGMEHRLTSHKGRWRADEGLHAQTHTAQPDAECLHAHL